VIPSERDVYDEPPPFLGTWSRVYTVVLIYLVAVIALFAWFTKAFNR
jgi:hypothetical protein